MSPVEESVLLRLANQLRRGEIVLFTGAGFSLAAQTRGGSHLPTVADLKAELSNIAFPGDPLDESSRLGDLFEVAVATAQTSTKKLLEARLRVDTTTLPESYAVWFSMPWARIYTVNVDDLDEAVARTFTLPRELDVISALRDEPLGFADRLMSVHLNGMLDDFPDFTFSQAQYGERAGRPDFWYQSLLRDLRARAVLFIGTELDEPSLWQYIELRGDRGTGKELRPGSYLVTPSISAARRAILDRHFNVDWIEMDEQQFVSEVLSQMEEPQREGIRTFMTRTAAGSEAALKSVADLRAQTRRRFA